MAATIVRVQKDDPRSRNVLGSSLKQAVVTRGFPKYGITIVCVGTDRSTGDALGPLVGTKLAEVALPGITVRGTLDDPIHAGNLPRLHDNIVTEARNDIIIAVDACLGAPKNVGTVCLKKGPLSPGSAVAKKLPSIGHMHVVGIVNVSGFMEYFVLQNTRLSLVMALARLITDSLLLCLADHVDSHFQLDGHLQRKRVGGYG